MCFSDANIVNNNGRYYKSLLQHFVDELSYKTVSETYELYKSTHPQNCIHHLEYFINVSRMSRGHMEGEVQRFLNVFVFPTSNTVWCD